MSVEGPLPALQPGECDHIHVDHVRAEYGGGRHCRDCGALLPPGPPKPPRWRARRWGEAMQTDEARELRAALALALDPLYAARLGNLPPLDAVLRAIARLHEIDRALLGVMRRAGTARMNAHDDALYQQARREADDKEATSER